MRWNCPHCNATLAVPDEKLKIGWSFSRCYKCAGFALVRRSDVNLIKVDQAPLGEPILLPEASEDPTQMMSKEATEHLEQTLSKPIVRPVSQRETQKSIFPPRPPRFVSKVEARGISVNQKIAALFSSELPAPLPQIPDETISKSHLLPIAIGIAGAVAVGSGIYLYMQGQQLWQKARQQEVPHAQVQPQPAPITETLSQAEVSHPNMLVQSHHEAPAQISDEVHQNAMAPIALESAQTPTLVVQPKLKNVSMRAGPGLQYPVLGLANPEVQYLVNDWKDRWFKVTVANPEAKDTPQYAWIRNDLVQLIQTTR